MKYTNTIILLVLLHITVLYYSQYITLNKDNNMVYGPQFLNSADEKAFAEEYGDITPEEAGKLYDMLAKAEHQGYVDPDSGEPLGDYSQWIRTGHQPKGGSTAYGPIQMTKSYLDHVPVTAEGQPMITFTDEEQKFINRFREQGQMFLDYGGEDMPPDKLDAQGNPVGHFDYGGRGFDWSDREKQLYRDVGEKYLEYEIKRNKGDLHKTVEAFRGKPYDQDSEYFDLVKSGWKKDYSNLTY